MSRYLASACWFFSLTACSTDIQSLSNSGTDPKEQARATISGASQLPDKTGTATKTPCRASQGLTGTEIYCSDSEFANMNLLSSAWNEASNIGSPCWSLVDGILKLNTEALKKANNDFSAYCYVHIPANLSGLSLYKSITISLLHEVAISTTGISGVYEPPQAQILFTAEANVPTLGKPPLLAITAQPNPLASKINQLVLRVDQAALNTDANNGFALRYKIEIGSALPKPTTSAVWNISSIAILGNN